MVGVIKEGMLQGLPVVLQGPSGPTVPTIGSPDVPPRVAWAWLGAVQDAWRSASLRGWPEHPTCWGEVSKPSASLRGWLEHPTWLECAPTVYVLQVVLFICFLVFPVVSTLAFEGLDLCDPFVISTNPETQEEESISFLMADYNVVCGTPAHTEVQALAAVAVMIYPIGIPFLYGVMLSRVRETLRARRATRFSEAPSSKSRPGPQR